jgi:alcohol dehydrogenase (cytochrome c)
MKTWENGSAIHGGSPIWVTGSYDPATNLTFWGTGNPNPGWNGDPRPGDNLYSDSVIALDADTGKLKWYYQFMPHDEFDWDSVQVPVLADIDYQGKPTKAMLWANRNGFFYVLDRTSGKFLMAKPFVKQNWNIGFDEAGRPILNPALKPKPMGAPYVEPGTQGGTNWYFPSFSPATGLFYISVWNNYGGPSMKGSPPAWKETCATWVLAWATMAEWVSVDHNQPPAAVFVLPVEVPDPAVPCPLTTAANPRASAPSAPSTRKPAKRSGTSK